MLPPDRFLNGSRTNAGGHEIVPAHADRDVTPDRRAQQCIAVVARGQPIIGIVELRTPHRPCSRRRQRDPVCSQSRISGSMTLCRNELTISGQLSQQRVDPADGRRVLASTPRRSWPRVYRRPASRAHRGRLSTPPRDRRLRHATRFGNAYEPPRTPRRWPNTSHSLGCERAVRRGALSGNLTVSRPAGRQPRPAPIKTLAPSHEMSKSRSSDQEAADSVRLFDIRVCRADRTQQNQLVTKWYDNCKSPAAPRDAAGRRAGLNTGPFWKVDIPC